MTHNEARIIGDAMAQEYLKCVTPDAGIGIHNALHVVAGSFEPKLQRIIIASFDHTVIYAAAERA